ncbi:MAG: DUF1501 domain-containing protein, partial [Planctomycetaceae bacterium]|nr:DUF1501 domain-containing protein [Planctomycetaceae bacterium]
SHHQGVEFRAAADPVLYINNPPGVDRGDRRELLDALGELAASQHAASNDAEVLSRVSQYEMAYRMQASVPEIADISSEPESVLQLYGPDVHKPGTFARNCLIARRLAERGVKYQTLFAMGWDHHLAIKQSFPVRCQEIDQPAAGLVQDLKQRGLLEDTIILWTTEFGRMPSSQGGKGRDHNPYVFTNWLCGGGIRGGTTYGHSDEWGYKPLDRDRPTQVYDIHATILHLLGIDHTKLTFRSNGIDRRLTDVHGHVIDELLA